MTAAHAEIEAEIAKGKEANLEKIGRLNSHAQGLVAAIVLYNEMIQKADEFLAERNADFIDNMDREDLHEVFKRLNKNL